MSERRGGTLLAKLATGFLLAAAIVGAASAADGPLNQAPKGFTNLFQGNDLSGWRGRQQDYSPYEEAKLSKAEFAAKQQAWNDDMAKHWRVDQAKGEIVRPKFGVPEWTEFEKLAR